MLFAIQTALQTETPHIGPDVPFVALFVGVVLAALLIALIIDYVCEHRGTHMPTDDALEELLGAASAQAIDPKTEAAYAAVQERCRAQGVTPPA